MKARRISFVFFLVITLVMSSFVMSFGSIYQGGDPTEQENINITCAYTLHDMGLFQGTENGFELDKQATRIQGIAMFIRILGQENAALAAGTDTTFTDVPNWAKAYTAYAEKQGLSKGLGNGKFGSDQVMTAHDYATFLLRGLGYDDSKGDFSYAESIDFFKQIGAITAEEKTYLTECDFKRGEMALMSYKALCTNPKGENKPLVEKLNKGWVVKADHTGVRGDDGGCAFQLHFTDIHSSNTVSEVYCQPLGYGFPIESCFLYHQISKDYKKIFYNTMNEVSQMTIGSSSDDGTYGHYTHGLVLCDASGNELALIRIHASMQNTNKENKKFISTPFPKKYEAPSAISDGVTYDKASGVITLDQEKISSQIGGYTKIYSTWVNYSDISSVDGYTPSIIVGAMHGRNGIKTYNGRTSTISVDSSKYYQLLLFMDADGNPIGCKVLDK